MIGELLLLFLNRKEGTHNRHQAWPDGWTRAISTEEFREVHGDCISNMRCCWMDRSRAKVRTKVRLRVRHLSKSRDPNTESLSSRTSDGILDLADIEDSSVGMHIPNVSGPSSMIKQNAGGSTIAISAGQRSTFRLPGAGIRRLRSFESMSGEFSREFVKVASESFDFWANISMGYFANGIPRGSEGSRASSTQGSNVNVPEAQLMVGFREQSQSRPRANWQLEESLVWRNVVRVLELNKA
jgi:hypothetical protein